MSAPLNSYTEDEFLAIIAEVLRKPGSGTVGIGDDCAVVEGGRLLKVDSVIEGRHFTPDTCAIRVGRKAVARVMSDFAAMGGMPHSFLVSCGLRGTTTVNYLRDFYAGMDAICAEYGGYLIGGETTTVPEGAPQYFSITGYGTCSQPVLRSGASVGDAIYVTGLLGNSFSTGHHLDFNPRLVESAWLMANARPSAMMDLSDGIARDLPRLVAASGVGYDLSFSAIPLRDGADLSAALTDGEDYELLFTVAPEKEVALKAAPFTATRIGTITADTTRPLSGGWDHLQQ